MKALRDDECFARVVAACPLQAHWLDGQPVTGVLPMAGITDRYHRFVVDGAPVATGIRRRRRRLGLHKPIGRARGQHWDHPRAAAPSDRPKPSRRPSGRSSSSPAMLPHPSGACPNPNPASRQPENRSSKARRNNHVPVSRSMLNRGGWREHPWACWPPQEASASHRRAPLTDLRIKAAKLLHRRF